MHIQKVAGYSGKSPAESCNKPIHPLLQHLSRAIFWREETGLDVRNRESKPARMILGVYKVLSE